MRTVPLKLSTTAQVADLLDRLALTGRFGKTGTEVGEELLRARLREVELEGWLEKAPKRRGPRRASPRR